ncbi:hypothetical protein C8R43DRAFT_1132807 [Mycena crocata]|nr:hypothetical protein C8R43DRAFT_1132807 [Mycena crocata]
MEILGSVRHERILPQLNLLCHGKAVCYPPTPPNLISCLFSRTDFATLTYTASPLILVFLVSIDIASVDQDMDVEQQQCETSLVAHAPMSSSSASPVACTHLIAMRDFRTKKASIPWPHKRTPL